MNHPKIRFTIKNYGEITATRNVGGIVGYHNGNGSGKPVVARCSNYADITATTASTSTANLGGIVGVSNGGATTSTRRAHALYRALTVGHIAP